MQITIFGIIWTIILVCSSISNSTRTLLFFTLLSMIFQCNNILSIGGIGIGVQIFTVSFTVVRFLLLRAKKLKYRAVSIVTGILFMLLFAIVISLIYNASFESINIIGFLMIAVYFVFAVIITKKKINIDYKWLEHAENIIIVFVLVIGAFQVFSKLGFSLFDGFLRTFIYNDIDNSNVIFNYKSSTAFYSTFMEPSYCGAFLVAAFSSVITRRDINIKNIVLSGCLIIAILLTRSSTAFGGLAIMLCMLWFVRSKKKIYKLFIPIFIITLIWMFTFNIEILNQVIFKKIGSKGSFSVRSNWNQLALRAFYQSPLTGIGFKNVRASSIYISLLGEIGILGIVPYSIMIIHSVIEFIEKKTAELVKSKYLFVFSIIVCQIIACPDLNFSPFWLGIYLLLLSMRCETNIVVNNGGGQV
ncbi:O-antigen ligase family protein [Sedimentibacter saalensis]|uniref:O-antigen ligase-like membrane protein n=1 Tax=Sedimentibacter saalensis TaxID=130788 RepID=A0A562J865_9FIRM|nr:hypothetical protein [Sedimentibacter saalensis]TWH79376.1 hypothetical protein LY60_02354 [Sedimentibacter saalensis]